MNADGSNVNRISPGASSRHFPAWSPDGSKIANSNYFAALCNRQLSVAIFNYLLLIRMGLKMDA